MKNEKSRAEEAGEQLGKAIIEMANLMYQNNTKRNFFKGLNSVLRESNSNENRK